MSHDIYEKRKEAYSEAYETAYSLPELIGPSDIDDTADTWGDITDEQIESEIAECLDVVHTESQYEGLIRDLAVTLWRDSLPRVSMDHLVFDDKAEAVRNGYWPNRMNKWDCEEILFERDIPSDVRDEAYEVVSAGVADKLDPRADKGDSL